MTTHSKIAHRSHKHDLEWVDSRGKYKCDGCKMDGIGPGYRCNKCDYDLHEECASGAFAKTFQGLKCRLFEQPLPGPNGCRQSRNCDACGVSIQGFVYHCAEKGLDFHPQCTNLKSNIFIEDVNFKLEKQACFNCRWCQKTGLKVKGYSPRIPGWSYVSEHGCNFHVYCVRDMAMKSFSNNTSSGSSAGLSVAYGNQEKALQAKFKGKRGSKWLKIFEIFLKTVLAILIGDPTVIIASTLAHIVTQGLFHAG